MRTLRARSAAIGVLVWCACPVLAAQTDRVSLSTIPLPGQSVRYRMTQELAVDVTPDGAGGSPLPAAKLNGKTVMAATMRAGDADEQGRLKVNITYDEFTVDMNINGQPSLPMPPSFFV